MYVKCTMYGDGKGLTWRWELGGEGKAFSTADRAVLQMVVITELTNFSYSQWVSSISYDCLLRDSEEYS